MRRSIHPSIHQHLKSAMSEVRSKRQEMCQNVFIDHILRFDSKHLIAECICGARLFRFEKCIGVANVIEADMLFTHILHMK